MVKNISESLSRTVSIRFILCLPITPIIANFSSRQGSFYQRKKYIKLTSGSKRGGTGGGVTETPLFATGGGRGITIGTAFIAELLPIKEIESTRPKGL